MPSMTRSMFCAPAAADPVSHFLPAARQALSVRCHTRISTGESQPRERAHHSLTSAPLIRRHDDHGSTCIIYETGLPILCSAALSLPALHSSRQKHGEHTLPGRASAGAAGRCMRKSPGLHTSSFHGSCRGSRLLTMRMDLPFTLMCDSSTVLQARAHR